MIRGLSRLQGFYDLCVLRFGARVWHSGGLGPAQLENHRRNTAWKTCMGSTKDQIRCPTLWGAGGGGVASANCESGLPWEGNAVQPAKYVQVLGRKVIEMQEGFSKLGRVLILAGSPHLPFHPHLTATFHVTLAEATPPSRFPCWSIGFR